MPDLKYDHTGKSFGLLTALHHVGGGNWLVRCECGVEKVVTGQNLRLRLKSCGCANPGGKRTEDGRPAGWGRGADHPRWQGTEVKYTTAHRRVAAKRGSASLHACIVCDEQATAWAYRGDSEQELTEIVGEGHLFKRPGDVLRFSPDPADYDPLCWTCHVRQDLSRRVNSTMN